MTTWLTAHLHDYGEGGISKKGKAYRVYSITIFQNRMEISARLILMGKALEYWETKLNVWQRNSRFDRSADAVITFAEVSKKWTNVARDVDIPLYFIFNRFHIKQSQQSSLEKRVFLTPMQKEMKKLTDVMLGRIKNE